MTPPTYPEIKIAGIRQETNNLMVVSWKTDDSLAGYEGLSVSLTRYHSDGSLAKTVGVQSVLETNFYDTVHVLSATSMFYEVSLLDSLEVVGTSRIVFPHDGLSRPAKGEILNVETALVDQAESLVLELARSPWVQHSAFSVAWRKGEGYTSRLAQGYESLTNSTIVLKKDFITSGPEFEIMVREEALKTPGYKYHLPGEWSEWVSVRRPAPPTPYRAKVRKRDTVAQVRCGVPADVKEIRIVIEGEKTITLTESVPAEHDGPWLEFDTHNLNVSEWYSVATYESGLVLTSEVAKTENTRSRAPVLTKAKQTGETIQIQFDLGKNLAAAETYGMFFAVNGKPVRRFDRGKHEHPLVVELPSEELSEGDWIQLFILKGRASPSYKYSATEGR